MKIIVFGATGNVGRKVLAEGISRGYEMTAFVRNPQKLREQQGEPAVGVRIVSGDMLDAESVREALAGQDAAILGAGNAGQGEEFVRIVDHLVSRCEEQPRFSGRVWVMGGAGLLEIPHTGIMGNDLPGLPPEYRNHNRNLDRLRRSRLDWTFMCPGTMFEAAEREVAGRLNVSTEEMPIPFPETVREMSHEELAGLIFARFQEIDVAYEDVTRYMLDHLEPAGPLSGKRVGLAYLQ
ncbi:NAD(P)-dependent oxidoreductase [Cohnella zeiphila]|uniref:NAD(P)H-binding protein n=1 Tax=Cohnella zeiphila TaxID=2761120 RepID=A0A7X0SPL1_9BACL|nr:NAD(P)H-binding protein [Cohnella zeiphila]MBB6733676.1 NAD(P)H-binding protein [Cohnella zeiphila]